MIAIRRSDERGHFAAEWLDSRHTFSFDTYHDPRHMGFRSLRVINEDHVAPGHGFPLHPHADMEIITVILAGALEHRDSLGHSEIIRSGEIQHMTAGQGIFHAEYNPSDRESVHLLQIWIHPAEKGLKPGYEKVSFEDRRRPDALTLIASRDGREGTARIHQDADLHYGWFRAGHAQAFPLAPGRGAWLQVLSGSLTLDAQLLAAGDGAAVTDLASLPLAAREEATFLLFDLA